MDEASGQTRETGSTTKKAVTMRQQNDRLFVFSGRMFAGKDFVAKSAGLTIKGFADPIYQLCEFFNGTANKSVPGIRRFLQQIGQWGWGCVSETYPHSTERATITRAIREHGKEMTRDFRWVDWSEYGKRQDFWVNIALTGLGLTARSNGQSFLFAEMNRREPYELAITNSRFEHELLPCLNAGFSHFHVRCTEETRRLRMTLAGYEFRPQDDEDASEQMARRLDMDMPESQVIWNDAEPMPAGKDYMSLSAFVDLLHGQQRFQHRPQGARLTTHGIEQTFIYPNRVAAGVPA